MRTETWALDSGAEFPGEYDTSDVVVVLGDRQWLSIETANDGGRMMTLFSQSRWDLLEMATEGLRKNSLTAPGEPCLSVGLCRDALVVSRRLGHETPTSAGLEAAARGLLEFAGHCGWR